MDNLIEENSRLRKENKRLKKRIEKLEKASTNVIKIIDEELKKLIFSVKIYKCQKK